MTRLLNEDPARRLADPALYEGRSDVDLELFDEGYDAVDTSKRQNLAARIEAGARSIDAPIISVTGDYEDARRESVRVHSNGFVGALRKTSYAMAVDVSLDDPSGSKPSDWDWVNVRRMGDLLSPDELGVRGVKRAVGRLGQTTLPSARMTMVVENRAASTLFHYLLQAFNGSMLQQDRSFLKGKQGQSIASDLLTLKDEPLIPRGLGSRYWNSDGMAAKPRTLVEAGTLREYLINVYYANKMGVAPTGGDTSNLVLTLGEKSPAELIKNIQKGVFVTSLLGGNSDSTRGDFSHGIRGYAIENGKLGTPIGGMNISGSHTDFWTRLVAVGNDPFMASSWRLPTVVFDDVDISGL